MALIAKIGATNGINAIASPTHIRLKIGQICPKMLNGI